MPFKFTFFFFLASSFFSNIAFTLEDPVCTEPALQTQAKITGQISVKDAGAAGLSSGEYSAQIQKAIDCAFAEGAGYQVFFPPGVYTINKALILHRDVDLVGVGVGWASVIKPTVSFNDIALINLEGASQNEGRAFKNSIIGINFDMDLAASAQTAISIKDANNIRIVNTYIRRSANSSGSLVPSISIDASNHIKLDDVIIYGNNSGGGVGLKIHNSWVTAINVDVEGFLRAIEVSESEQGKGKLSMYGGYLERFSHYGIKFSNTSYNRVDGVVIKLPNSSPWGIHFENSTNNLLSGLSIVCYNPTTGCKPISGGSSNTIENSLLEEY